MLEESKSAKKSSLTFEDEAIDEMDGTDDLFIRSQEFLD